MTDTPLAEGPDGQPRCAWCLATPAYQHYHDTEWGFPVGDDRRLFEKISLEGFQCGLSWLTILNKREAFRAAFAGFDFEAVARFGEADVARLLQNPGIVRHRGKIEAVINNARCAIALREKEGSLAAFFWRFEPDPVVHARRGLVAETPESAALSRALRKQGWRYVGPTTLHAFMQAMGLVNDHAPGCCTRARAEAARQAFRRPA
ncbi:DNA-3-methyladenine glycosylase I [Pedomonas sp. V897]|uniref:DNA-3-methyladenine glycosylase I n=1 Tax=Pedomonas sp. V897 TaxID=3446482 RepID=UPI003EDF3448